MQLSFFGNIRYGICNIYFKLITLNRQIKIYVELAKTKKTFLTTILCVSISYSIFNKNQ